MESQHIEYVFKNVKKDPIDKQHLETITNNLGMDAVFNMKGPTFRKMKLNYGELSSVKRLYLLFANQGMIKRPLLEKDNRFHVGFDEDKILDFLK